MKEPATLVLAPKAAADWADIVKPRQAPPRTEMAFPSDEFPVALNDDPRRMKLITESELPRQTESRTDADFPTHTALPTDVDPLITAPSDVDILEPRRANCLSDIELAINTDSTTDTR